MVTLNVGEASWPLAMEKGRSISADDRTSPASVDVPASDAADAPFSVKPSLLVVRWASEAPDPVNVGVSMGTLADADAVTLGLVSDPVSCDSLESEGEVGSPSTEVTSARRFVEGL